MSRATGKIASNVGLTWYFVWRGRRIYISRAYSRAYTYSASQIRRRRRRRLSARPSHDRRRDWPKGLANMNASHYACTDLSRGHKVGISERVTSRRCCTGDIYLYIRGWTRVSNRNDLHTRKYVYIEERHRHDRERKRERKIIERSIFLLYIIN